MQQHYLSHSNNLVSFILYCFKSVTWFAAAYYISGYYASAPLWVAAVSVYVFSLPIVLCGIYIGTISQIRRLNIFISRGWLFKLFSARPLKIILWICWALITSFFILLQFQTYTDLEWLIFFLVIPVFFIVFHIVQTIIAHEIKPYLVISLSLAWSRRLTPLIMLLIYMILHLYGAAITIYPSIQEAIRSTQTMTDNMTSSAMIQEFSRYLSLYESVKIYTFGKAAWPDNFLMLVLLGIANLVIFYNACAMLTCFLIPAKEYRRMFAPLSDTDQPHFTPASRIAVMSALIVFLTLFIYVPTFSYLEAYFQQTSAVSRQHYGIIENRVIQIDNAFFQENTLEELYQAKIEALHKVEAAFIHLEEQADLAFDRLEANVDLYLDWYYSLAGEYSRIANLLIGELEGYMLRKLEETLNKGNVFDEFQQALNNLLDEYQQAQQEYQQAAQEILHKNRLTVHRADLEVLHKMSMDDILHPPIHHDVVALQYRLSAGGTSGMAAGAITAVVVKKIMGKIMGKNILKLAAKALIKVVISKSAGTAAGAGAGVAVGAAAGSVVPVLGTAAGAVIGGIVGGIIVGVSVDKLLLELEEAMSREDFKQQILNTIHETRQEFKAGLRN